MEKGSHDGPSTTSNNHRKRAGQREDPKPPPDLILPEPTFSVIDQNKKSHAKKQPAGHIPRPRNAFILFRCDFVRQQKIPPSVEKDHRNISRIIGKIWQQMTDDQKGPWKQMAEQEKVNHRKIYPNYKFSVSLPTKKKVKRGDNDASTSTIKEEPEMSMKTEDVHIVFGRSSSCPPGAELVSQSAFEARPPGFGDPLRTRDDLSRRPTSTVYYRSSPYELVTEMDQPRFFANPVNTFYLTQALINNDFPPLSEEEMLAREGTDENLMIADPVRFCGPRLFEPRLGDNLQLWPYSSDGPISPGPDRPFIPLMSTEEHDRPFGKWDDDHFLSSEELLSTLPPLPREW